MSFLHTFVHTAYIFIQTFNNYTVAKHNSRTQTTGGEVKSELFIFIHVLHSIKRQNKFNGKKKKWQQKLGSFPVAWFNSVLSHRLQPSDRQTEANVLNKHSQINGRCTTLICSFTHTPATDSH